MIDVTSRFLVATRFASGVWVVDRIKLSLRVDINT